VGNRFAHEGFKSTGFEVSDHAGDDVALAADGADDSRLARTDTAGPFPAAALTNMPVLGLSTDKRLIDLDNPAKLLDIFHQGDADLVAHFPSCPVGTKTHVAHDLQGAHALLANQHQVNDFVPVPQGLVAILEDCADCMGKPIAGRASGCTFGALPVPFARRQVIDGRIAATRTTDAFRPTAGNKIGPAMIFVWEHHLEFGGGKLWNRLGLLGAHDFSPSIEGYWHA